MALISSKGYIGIAKQTNKDTPNSTPEWFVRYLEEGFQAEHDVTHLREGGDDELVVTSIKNQHRERFTFKFNARPESTAWILGYLLGNDDAAQGEGENWWTHSITRDSITGRAWLTLRRKIAANVVQELRSAKIEAVTIEGAAGQPLTIAVEGSALTAFIDTTPDADVYEPGKPFTFYQSSGQFKIGGNGTNKNIKSFSLKLTVASQEGMQTDDITLADLPDLKFDIEGSIVLYAEDESFWHESTYNTASGPQHEVSTGSFEFKCSYTETDTDDRQFQVILPELVWQPVTGINLNPEPIVMEETLAFIARKPSSGNGNIITVTIRNGKQNPTP